MQTRLGILLVVPTLGYALSIQATYTGFSVAERQVAEASILVWEQLILDPFDVEVNLSKQSIAGDFLAFSTDFVASSEGLPQSASIVVDDRVDATFGWFVDSTPLTAEEYLAPRGNTYFPPNIRNPAANLYDLFTVLNHEIGHVLGFSVEYDLFADHVPPGSGSLRRYEGESFSATLTPTFDGTHLHDSIYPRDLMVAFAARGDRRLPTALDLTILSDAYGYSIGTLAYPVPEISTFSSTVCCIVVLVFTKRFKR